jgi:hypothetical protein
MLAVEAPIMACLAIRPLAKVQKVKAILHPVECKERSLGTIDNRQLNSDLSQTRYTAFRRYFVISRFTMHKY